MKGILSSLMNSINNGADDFGDDNRTPTGKQITRQRAQELGGQAAQEFQRADINLLSCFDLKGLFSALAVEIEDEGLTGLEKLVVSGDERGFMKAMYNAQALGFMNLLNRGALNRYKLVDAWPAAAARELVALGDYVRSLKAAAPAATPVAAAAPAAPVVVSITPEEQCAKDWRELGSRTFKAKYMIDTRMRAHFENAQAQGLI